MVSRAEKTIFAQWWWTVDRWLLAALASRAGDRVELLAFDREKIKFEWHEKAVEKKFDELVAKEASPSPAAAPGARASRRSR